MQPTRPSSDFNLNRPFLERGDRLVNPSFYYTHKELIRRIQALNLDSIVNSRIPLLKNLSLNSDDPCFAGQQLMKQCLPRWFTFKSYMNEALYNEKFGYYSTHSSVGMGFITNPIKYAPYYGAALAEVVCAKWEKMVSTGEFKIDEPISICEFGAGTGRLAHDFMTYAKEQAEKKEGKWAEFYAALTYVIGEISPKLRKLQAQATALFQQKVNIRPADAKHLRSSFAEKSIKGFIISNELLDVFPMHKVRKDRSQRLEVAFVIPTLHYNGLSLTEEEKEQLVKESCFFQDSLSAAGVNRMISFSNQKSERDWITSPEYCLLSKTSYLSLKEKHKNLLQEPLVTWQQIWIKADYVPKVRKFYLDHADFFQSLEIGQETPLVLGVRSFQKGVSDIMDKGVVLTIDYQYANQEFRQRIKRVGSFRCYPTGERHQFSNSLGEYDITADIDASIVAAEGKKVGLKTVFFGSEKDLFQGTKNILNIEPEGLRFNVLIQQKESEKFPVVRESSCPVTFRELFIKHEKRIKHSNL